jgi:DNA-binding NarL/FixJ family response regulator
VFGPADVVAAIRAVAHGETYLQPSLGVVLARSRSWDALLRLTPQEEQVLRLLVLGHTNADIARLCKAPAASRRQLRRQRIAHVDP